jgi:MFS family permease
MSTYWLTNWSTIAVLWAAYILVTCAELFHAAANWGYVAELSDPLRRAEYQGVWRLGQQAVQMVGPALFTWLAVTWRPEGFLVIGAVAVAAAVAMPVVAGAAQRRLAVELAKPTRVGSGAADTIEESSTPD